MIVNTNKIRELMAEHGLTEKSLGDAMGMPQTTVSSILTKQTTKPQTLRRIENH